MTKNYLSFPMKYLTVTQAYNGKASHLTHTTGKPVDYPVDLGGTDSGRDWVYCPCDKIKIIRIYGVGNSGVNSVWATSVKKVFFADGTSDYATIQFTHMNDDDLKKIKVGQVFKRKEKMFREGKDGATANHIHLSVGKGRIKGNGWVKNSNGKWVLTATGGAVKPEKAFYIDTDFTSVNKTGGLVFKNLPMEKKYIVTTALNIRSGHSTSCKKVGLYKKGTEVTVTEVYASWGLTEKGWICLDYVKEATKWR